MTNLARRPWVGEAIEDYVGNLAQWTQAQDAQAIEDRITALAAENKRIHERQCVNLNPATNTMNPKARVSEFRQRFDKLAFVRQAALLTKVSQTFESASIDFSTFPLPFLPFLFLTWRNVNSSLPAP